MTSVLRAAGHLRDETRALAFGPRVAYAYAPLDYAWDVHRRFVARYAGGGPKRLLFVGMNPGPWGMAQTGVPFADARRARWMGLRGRVERPERAHPKRPVLGLACPRRDASGERFYAWAESRWGAAERFFADAYVVNYCPLLFLDEAGRNLTPPTLRRSDALMAACDAHLAAVLDALRPARVVGVGRWAEAQARRVAGDRVEVIGVLHPSPASPATNAGWARHVDAVLPDVVRRPADGDAGSASF